ncbi:MAG TPA: DNA alkylation repair protein [Candidatus Nanoarchaeia archaeon]|nr:DNA alkylation repair protein [Candidatus Nanoarchaeia archaeon]
MLKELRASLKENADKTYNYNMFFKEPIKAYGVRYTVLRKIAKDFFPENVDVAVLEELWQSGWHEESVVAVMWAKQGNIAAVPLMKKWLDKYASNWAQVDDICLNVLCPLLEKNASLLPEIKSWAKSKNLWTRRASAVSFVYPCRRGLYVKDIFEVAEQLLPDKEDLIQKAYGWALREAGKTHQKEVFQFILKHKDRMGRTALRYAIELMPKSLKQRAMAKNI